jgi:murein DD-endopeptidase MepM/ murein hydrolase activator NlpD
MTAITRARRDATARMTRWFVVLAASTAVLGIGYMVRSWEAQGSGFVSAVPAFEERAASPGAASTAPVAAPTAPVAERSDTAPESPPPGGVAPLEDLRSRALTLPVIGTRPEQLVASFGDERGARRHEAIDILAPIGTPVVAVESGRIQKLFTSERGGLTIYQFDPRRRYAYYYAHLSRYADTLKEGQDVARGEIIGFVGISGNAPPDTPHLHFAIFELGPEQQWWKGTPVDPYLVWRPQAE